MISVGETERALQAQRGFYKKLKIINLAYLHADGQDRPSVLFDFENFNCVVDFLFSASEESSEGVDEFVVDCTGT